MAESLVRIQTKCGIHCSATGAVPETSEIRTALPLVYHPSAKVPNCIMRSKAFARKTPKTQRKKAIRGVANYPTNSHDRVGTSLDDKLIERVRSTFRPMNPRPKYSKLSSYVTCVYRSVDRPTDDLPAASSFHREFVAKPARVMLREQGQSLFGAKPCARTECRTRHGQRSNGSSRRI